MLLFICIFRVEASTNTSSSYIIMDMESKRVLKGKDIHSSRLIASITKIMTATLAIESGKIDDVVVVDDSIKDAYGSGVYIEVGEEITLRDLVYGLLLRSGNDAASMIASYVGGSKDNFVKMMNDKAKELGMNDTIFYNPSGLPTPKGNYSSTYDMALLTSYAMKSSIYREIVKTKKYKVTTNKKTYIWHNKNKLLRYDFITGGKTGFTKESGRTLVSTGLIDDMKLVCVTIRDSDDWNTHLELYDYVKDNYHGYKILSKNSFNVIGDSYYKNSSFYINNDIYVALRKNERGALVNKIMLDRKKNYINNDKVGKSIIYLDNDILYEEDIYIKKYNKKKRISIIDKFKALFND